MGLEALLHGSNLIEVISGSGYTQIP